MSTTTSGRLTPLDALRGWIMVIMAIDHASAFIAHRHAVEFWGGAWSRYTEVLPFFTRFVTHLCAPGFSFLMGAGMALFAAARAARGWSQARIGTHLLLRGLLLLLVNQVLENPAWMLGSVTLSQGAEKMEPIPGVGGQMYVVFTVLTGLGLVMAACAYFMRMGAVAWVTVGLAAMAATEWLTPAAERFREAIPIWKLLLVTPGMAGHVVGIYPLIPWLAPAALGIAFGKAIREDATRALGRAPWVGLGMVALAVTMRAAGGPGNLRLPRDGSWIEFLNFIKYPPAAVFTLFMVGADLLLLGLFTKIGGSWLARTLEVYGRTPLAFYLAHLYLYALAGVLLFRNGVSLAGMYPVWLAGLVPLYFVCRWFADFKAQKPVDSVWRLF